MKKQREQVGDLAQRGDGIPSDVAALAGHALSSPWNLSKGNDSPMDW
jgi:hypothetical protein